MRSFNLYCSRENQIPGELKIILPFTKYHPFFIKNSKIIPTELCLQFFFAVTKVQPRGEFQDFILYKFQLFRYFQKELKRSVFIPDWKKIYIYTYI